MSTKTEQMLRGEIERRKALAAATQLECNRLAEDVKQAETRLVRVVEALTGALDRVRHGDAIQHSRSLHYCTGKDFLCLECFLKAALAAAQDASPEDASLKIQCDCPRRKALGGGVSFCPDCGLYIAKVARP